MKNQFPLLLFIFGWIPNYFTSGKLPFWQFLNVSQVLDHKVFSQKYSVDEDDELDAASSFEQVNDASVLYCERFMEFLIDLLSQLPTRRYCCSFSFNRSIFLFLFLVFTFIIIFFWKKGGGVGFNKCLIVSF